MTSIKWVQFFKDAGLPEKLSTKYAVIFNDHRIQYDMLKDLNKEYLADMGIKTMGDVIAILRHAKVMRPCSRSRNELVNHHAGSRRGSEQGEVASGRGQREFEGRT